MAYYSFKGVLESSNFSNEFYYSCGKIGISQFYRKFPFVLYLIYQNLSSLSAGKVSILLYYIIVKWIIYRKPKSGKIHRD